MKIAYFVGTNHEITEVMAKRQADETCLQLPRKDDKIGAVHHVRVFYFLEDDGPWIHHIDIRLGNKWNCFFEQDIRAGSSSYCNGRFHSHYLASVQCVRDILRRWEKSRAIHELSRFGPDVFPELEESDEPDPPLEVDDDPSA